MPEADFLCVQLASCGIEAYIPDQYTASVLPLHGSALGGIRIQVEESDLERATAVLRDLSDVTETEKTKCPECDSDKIESKRVSWQFAVIIVLLVGIPLLWLRKEFTCCSCGHRFQLERE